MHTHTTALSAYQHYQQLSPLESSTNTSVTYGLGLIYFNMNVYKWWVSPNTLCRFTSSVDVLTCQSRLIAYVAEERGSPSVAYTHYVFWVKMHVSLAS